MAKFIFRNTWLQALCGAEECDTVKVLDGLCKYVWGEGTKGEISEGLKMNNFEEGLFGMMSEQIDTDREKFPEVFKEGE